MPLVIEGTSWLTIIALFVPGPSAMMSLAAFLRRVLKSLDGPSIGYRFHVIAGCQLENREIGNGNRLFMSVHGLVPVLLVQIPFFDFEVPPQANKVPTVRAPKFNHSISRCPNGRKTVI